MNAKQAKAIRRIHGDNKQAARRMRRAYARSATSAAQCPLFRHTSPDVATGRPANGRPIATAPQDKPLRAIFSIANEQKTTARILIANAVFPGDCGRDPIKYLAHGPRARVNAVLQQIRAA